MDKKVILGATLLSLFYASSNFALPPLSSQYAVGFYNDEMNQMINPLILKSKDNGRSWTFMDNVPISSYRSSHFLESISCTGSTCIAGGNYGNYEPQPLLLKTTDDGMSWTYERNIANLPEMNRSFITSTNCSGATCLANGFYSNQQTTEYPLLLVSRNMGRSWTSVNQIHNMPNAKHGAILNATCEGDSCVGILHTTDINDEGTYHAMPIVSRNKGRDWAYVKTIDNLPQNNTVDIWSLRCQHKTCVSGGFYTKPNDRGERRRQPILTISRDNGTHWRHVDEITGLPPLTHGTITSITYSGSTWVAAGRYGMTSDTEVSSPLMLVSKDDGKHWSFVKNIRNLPNKSTRINGVTCQGSACIAVGYYLKDVINEADGFELPVLLVSNDRGKSYRFVNEIENLPAMKGAEVSSINCKGKTCTAVGHYDDINNGDTHNDAIYYPFVLTSNDMGQHWTYVHIQNLPNMQYGTIESMTNANGNFKSTSVAKHAAQSTMQKIWLSHSNV